MATWASVAFSGCIERIKFELLQSMFSTSVTLSVCHVDSRIFKKHTALDGVLIPPLQGEGESMQPSQNNFCHLFKIQPMNRVCPLKLSFWYTLIIQIWQSSLSLVNQMQLG